MTPENIITPANSPLLCDQPAWQNTTLLLISMRYLIYFFDVNGSSVNSKVTVILYKRRYQSINQSSLSAREIAVFDVHHHSSQHSQDDDATH